MNWRQTIRTPTPYTKAISSTSASTELRSRIADAMAASNRVMALSGIRLRSRNCFTSGPHAPVHHKLGNDQQGHRQQEANVNFHVHQEGYGRTPAQHLSFQSREHQERQPGKQRDDDDASAHQHQRIVGQVRAAQKLEERPAKDEREVVRIRGHIVSGR